MIHGKHKGGKMPMSAPSTVKMHGEIEGKKSKRKTPPRKKR